MSDIYLARKADGAVKTNRWIASLSNGETIFEDKTPGMSPAWERLAAYLKQNNLKITKLRLQLGHLEVDMPPHAHGYIQKKKLIATIGHAKEHYGVGHVDKSGKALIHYVSDDGGSWSEIINDPGPPWTIYS